MKYPECERCKKIVGPVNFWGNVGLAIFKFIFAFTTGSYALLADAVHSLGDVVSAAVTLVCIWISGKKADEDHPYGHGKIEFIGSAFIGISLLFVGVFLVWYSLQTILTGTPEAPDSLAIHVTIISIVVNYLMYKHCLCVGEKVDSPVLVATARENYADAISSVPVLIGVVGAQFGFPCLDPIAAVVLGFIIVHQAYATLKEATRGLGDAALDEEKIDSIRKTVKEVRGVLGIDRLLTRRIGQDIEIAVRVKVDSTATVEFSKGIAGEIKEVVKKSFEGFVNIEIGFQGIRIEGTADKNDGGQNGK